MSPFLAVPIPQLMPNDWRLVERALDGEKYLTVDGLSVITSASVEQDGRRWLHVSMARADRLPSWDDVRLVKDAVIGRRNYAIQVVPPESKHVNIHPYCLHLFHCLDGHHLPDFTRGGASL